ncbi:MAG TPA: sigma-70 family RNA polymerase sigma factor [Gemmatimonadales bacterium]|nr:sigma-70 family RNA polymerase sigma factor [Gemmatimonadales bacterium]
MAELLPPALAALLCAEDPRTKDEAWTGFVAAYSRLLLTVARTIGQEYDLAMDYYTYVLEHLHQHDCARLRGYAVQPQSEFATWLVVVARRLCLDRYRQQYGRVRPSTGPRAKLDARRADRQLRRQLVDLVTTPDGVVEVMDTASVRADDAVGRAELVAMVHEAMQHLPPRERLLLRLRFEDGMPARVIAERLGVPTPFHVYRSLRTALGHLRLELARRGVTAESA